MLRRHALKPRRASGTFADRDFGIKAQLDTACAILQKAAAALEDPSGASGLVANAACLPRHSCPRSTQRATKFWTRFCKNQVRD
jgi:hypothetical protein